MGVKWKEVGSALPSQRMKPRGGKDGGHVEGGEEVSGNKVIEERGMGGGRLSSSLDMKDRP